MTKEEYLNFCLRYRGCGACFPLYEKLNRFEKMWFTAIQQDVAELEKENAELKSELSKKAVTNHSLVEQMADLESENAELKEQYVCFVVTNYNKQLTKAKKLLEEFCTYCMCDCEGTREDGTYEAFEELRKQAEQFLKEIEK